MSPAEFKPTILESERPQTHALDRVGIGVRISYSSLNTKRSWAGSLARMEKMKYASAYSGLVYKTKGRRQLGRRKYRWEHQL